MESSTSCWDIRPEAPLLPPGLLVATLATQLAAPSSDPRLHGSMAWLDRAKTELQLRKVWQLQDVPIAMSHHVTMFSVAAKGKFLKQL